MFTEYAARLSHGHSKLAALTVGKFMHEGIVSCGPETPLRHAARLMARENVHSLVVFGVSTRAAGHERLAWGFLTDLELLQAARTESRPDLRVGDLVTSEVVTMEPDESLDTALQLMLDLGTTHLIVVSPDDQRPVGVLSSLDVARALAA